MTVDNTSAKKIIFEENAGPEIPHPQYRDRLFKAIFGRLTEQSKRWRLDLYNALNNSSYTDPDALELNTIENVIYITMKNDISFLVDSQMTLFEQQSSFNPNMPLRGFLYFSQLYQIYLSSKDISLHKPKLMKIPTPKFIVFYNGKKKYPDRLKLRLSDAFENHFVEESGDFEWTAEMININKNNNFNLQKKCKSLYDYISYVSRVSDNKDRGLSTKDSVNEAIDWAIKENLLEGFFKIQKEEILAMYLTEYNEEALVKSCFNDGFEDGLEQGIEQGIEQGREETLLKTAKNLFVNGVSVELISKSLNMTQERVLEIVNC